MLKSYIDRIIYVHKSKDYQIHFKNNQNKLSFYININNADAKNIALAREGISSTRLKTYDSILNFSKLMNTTFIKVKISKDIKNLVGTLDISKQNKIYSLNTNIIDSIIISIIAVCPLYIQKSLYNIHSFKKDTIISDYKISKESYSRNIEKTMKMFINNEDYESAAILRDKIKKIN
jgi:bifunctional DNase/RNase